MKLQMPLYSFQHHFAIPLSLPEHDLMMNLDGIIISTVTLLAVCLVGRYVPSGAHKHHEAAKEC